MLASGDRTFTGLVDTQASHADELAAALREFLKAMGVKILTTFRFMQLCLHCWELGTSLNLEPNGIEAAGRCWLDNVP